MTEQEMVKLYEDAIELIVYENYNPTETKKILIKRGLDEESVSSVVGSIEKELNEQKKKIEKAENNEAAKNNMIYGALWFSGGLIATMADFGYFFWGAIIFGGIQFLKGIFDFKK